MEGLDTARSSDISFHIQGLGGDILLTGNRPLDVQYGLYLPSACFLDFEVLEGVDEEASPSEGRNAATWPSSPAVNTTPLCNMSGLFETEEVGFIPARPHRWIAQFLHHVHHEGQLVE